MTEKEMAAKRWQYYWGKDGLPDELKGCTTKAAKRHYASLMRKTGVRFIERTKPVMRQQTLSL